MTKKVEKILRKYKVPRNIKVLFFGNVFYNIDIYNYLDEIIVNKVGKSNNIFEIKKNINNKATILSYVMNAIHEDFKENPVKYHRIFDEMVSRELLVSYFHNSSSKEFEALHSLVLYIADQLVLEYNHFFSIPCFYFHLNKIIKTIFFKKSDIFKPKHTEFNYINNLKRIIFNYMKMIENINLRLNEPYLIFNQKSLTFDKINLIPTESLESNILLNIDNEDEYNKFIAFKSEINFKEVRTKISNIISLNNLYYKESNNKNFDLQNCNDFFKNLYYTSIKIEENKNIYYDLEFI